MSLGVRGLKGSEKQESHPPLPGRRGPPVVPFPLIIIVLGVRVRR